MRGKRWGFKGSSNKFELKKRFKLCKAESYFILCYRDMEYRYRDIEEDIEKDIEILKMILGY